MFFDDDFDVMKTKQGGHEGRRRKELSFSSFEGGGRRGKKNNHENAKVGQRKGKLHIARLVYVCPPDQRLIEQFRARNWSLGRDRPQ